MQIEKTIDDDILVLSLAGDFDTTDVDNFEAEITGAIEAGFVRILLDLGEMPFINSTALGAMLTAQKRTSQFGGGIAAANAQGAVSKTMKILGLDQKVALHEMSEDALAYLRSLIPEGVSTTGEEVEFFRPDAEETFGARPRRGRLEEMNEEGLTFSFENLDGMDAEGAFPVGELILLRFLLPLYHPTHVFEAGASVKTVEVLGRETIQVGVIITELSEPEREAIRQYVKDLKLIKGQD